MGGTITQDEMTAIIEGIPKGRDVEERAQRRIVGESIRTQEPAGFDPQTGVLQTVDLESGRLPEPTFESRFVPAGRFTGMSVLTGGLPPMPSVVMRLAQPTDADLVKHDQSLEVQAARHGIATDKPLRFGQFVASFAFDESEQIKAYELALREAGQTVSAEQPPIMRRDENTGEVVYYDFDTRRYTLAAPLKLTPESMAGPGIVLAAEVGGAMGVGILGALAGTAAVPFLGTFGGAAGGMAAGAAAGAAVGEFLRLEIGNALGINRGLTWEQYAKRMAMVGGVSYIGGIAGAGLMRAARFMYLSSRGKTLPKDLQDLDPDSPVIRGAAALEDRFNQVLKQARHQARMESKHRAISRRKQGLAPEPSGGPSGILKFNIAQATGNQRLLAIQEVLQRDPKFAEQYARFTEGQQKALADFWTTIHKSYLDAAEHTDVNAGLSAAVNAHRRNADLSLADEDLLARLQANPNPSQVENGEIARLLHQRNIGRQNRAANAELQDAYSNLGDFASSRLAFAKSLREYGVAEQAEFTRWADDLAGDIGNMLRGEPDAAISAVNFVAANSKLRGEAMNVIIESLGRRKAEFLGPVTTNEAQAVRLGAGGQAGVTIPSDQLDVMTREGMKRVIDNTVSKLSRNFNPNTKLTFDEAWETLRAIRSAARQGASGATTDAPDIGSLKLVAEALEKDMNLMFARNGNKNPFWQASFRMFNKEYQKGKNLLDEGVIGRMLQRTGPGAEADFVKPIDEVGDDIWGAGKQGLFDNAEKVVALMDRQAADTMAFRKALAQEYESRVITVNPRTGAKSIEEAGFEAHKEFIDMFVARQEGGGRSVLDVMGFTTQELAQMTSPGKAGKVLFARQEAFDRLQLKLDEEFGDLLKPKDLIETVWTRAKDPSKLRKLMRILKVSGPTGAPVLRGLRRQVIEQMTDAVTVNARPGETVFSATKLISFIEGKNIPIGDDIVRTTATRANKNLLEELFGKQYLGDLRTMAEAVHKTQLKHIAGDFSNTSFTANLLKGVARAYVGLFTRPGRMITAIASIRARAANDVLMQAMASPNILREMIVIKDMNMLSSRVARFIASVNATELYNYGGDSSALSRRFFDVQTEDVSSVVRARRIEERRAIASQQRRRSGRGR
jgi:hypothetical protein